MRLNIHSSSFQPRQFLTGLVIYDAMRTLTKRIDPQVPSQWTRFKKGDCDGCWAGCCTLPVEVSAVDLMRLELITEDEAAVSLKKVAKRLMKEGLIQAFQ